MSTLTGLAVWGSLHCTGGDYWVTLNYSLRGTLFSFHRSFRKSSRCNKNSQ